MVTAESSSTQLGWFRWKWFQNLAAGVAGFLVGDIVWKMAEAGGPRQHLDDVALILFLTLLGWKRPTQLPTWGKVVAVLLIGVIAVSFAQGVYDRWHAACGPCS